MRWRNNDEKNFVLTMMNPLLKDNSAINNLAYDDPGDVAAD